MHELAVCLSLLDQVQRIAAEHRAEGVEQIVLAIGPLSGVEGALLRHAWPLAAAGSIAADAELVIDSVPVRVTCNDCGAATDASANRLLCGACGSWRTRLVSGNELLLAHLELRVPDDAGASMGTGTGASTGTNTGTGALDSGHRPAAGTTNPETPDV